MPSGTTPTPGNHGPTPPFAYPPGPGGDQTGIVAQPSPEEERRRRRRRLLLFLLIGILGALLLLLSWFALRYFLTHEPLPLPNIVAPSATVPTYRYSLYGVDAPVGVAVTPNGDRIYVTESAGELELKVLDSSGTILAAGVPPDSQPSNRVPVYVARDPLTGELYVTDRLNGVINIYDAAGTYARTYTPPTDIEAWQPLGVAFDDAGLLYVTEVGSAEHRILVIDRAGTLLRTVTTRSGLVFPNAVAPVGDDLYATDSNNSLLVRAAAGAEVAVPVAGPGVGAGDLALPRGLATDSRGRLYVADTTGHRVLVYELPTERGARPKFLDSFGSLGRDEGQFNYPNGIAADDQGRFYVADQANNRIQVWSY